MRARRNFAAVAFCGLVLCSGCGHPAEPTSEAALEPEYGNSASDFTLSAERWKIMQLPDDHVYLTVISGAGDRGLMLLSCSEQSGTLTASLVLGEHLSGDPRRRSVDLLFDEGGFASPPWKPRQQTATEPSAFDIVEEKGDGFDYEYYAYAHALWHHLSNLKKHDVVVAVVRVERKEVSRYRFSLAGAKETIDKVVTRCGQKLPS